MYKLIGKLSPVNTLTGRLTGIMTITGQLTTPQVVPPDIYEGEYVVTPKAWVIQTLDTDDKYMEADVTVLEVPYQETDNQDGGRTISIAYIM